MDGETENIDELSSNKSLNSNDIRATFGNYGCQVEGGLEENSIAISKLKDLIMPAAITSVELSVREVQMIVKAFKAVHIYDYGSSCSSWKFPQMTLSEVNIEDYIATRKLLPQEDSYGGMVDMLIDRMYYGFNIIEQVIDEILLNMCKDYGTGSNGVESSSTSFGDLTPYYSSVVGTKMNTLFSKLDVLLKTSWRLKDQAGGYSDSESVIAECGSVQSLESERSWSPISLSSLLNIQYEDSMVDNLYRQIYKLEKSNRSLTRSQAKFNSQIADICNKLFQEQKKSKKLDAENVSLNALLKKKTGLIQSLRQDACRLRKRCSHPYFQAHVKLLVKRVKVADTKLTDSQRKLVVLRQENDDLNTELKHSRETIELMQFYPDVNGHVPVAEDSKLSVKQMMENQCKANLERITVLMEMNRSYEKAIEAMKENDDKDY